MLELNTLFYFLLSITLLVSFLWSYNLGRLAGTLLFTGLLIYSFSTFEIMGIIISFFALLSLVQEFFTERRRDKTTSQRLHSPEGAKIRMQAGALITAIGIFSLMTVRESLLLATGLVILTYGIYQHYKSHPLPTMTKAKHWALIGTSYIAVFILAFAAFMSPLPMLGLFIIPIPFLLTVVGIVLYLKNTQRSKS